MSAYFASSRVLLNASIRLCGSFLINPTVSVSRTFSPLGSSILLVVGSSVAKSLFSDNTPASVSLLRSVDLPALVYPTIAATGVEGKPVVTLFNKCDVLPEKPAAKDLHADYTYNISAVRGNGLEAFKECLQEIILKSRIRIERVFPYSEAGKIQLIRQFGQLESEEYTEDGIKVLAYVPKEIEGKL